jgi:hypothetical protein
MAVKTSTAALAGILPRKLAGSEGTPPAAAAGLVLPGTRRHLDRKQPAVRPASIARFPGLLCPSSHLGIGGTAL